MRIIALHHATEEEVVGRREKTTTGREKVIGKRENVAKEREKQK